MVERPLRHEGWGDPNRRRVFVVHGRNRAARDGMFAFLRALDVNPIEWSQAVAMTGEGSPYIGTILDTAFSSAQAVVVLLTPDEITYLRSDYAAEDDPDTTPAAQARPNVLFEAGMAMGRDARRTVLVELGQLRPFSDVAGRHAVRLDNSSERRADLAERLWTAGCAVNTSGSDWLTAGDLNPPPPPGGSLPLGKRMPLSQRKQRIRFDLRYHDRGKGSGRLEIVNQGTEAVYDLNLELPQEAGSFHLHSDALPLKRLPAGKNFMLIASRSMGPGQDHFDVRVKGRLEDGTAVEEDVFLSLIG